MDGLIGAGQYERSAERKAYRNGFHDRALDTRFGTLQLRIPKLRSGSAYFPLFLEPRKTSERALAAVIQAKRAAFARGSMDRQRVTGRWAGKEIAA